MLLSDVQQHFSELRVNVKSVRRVRQFLQQAGYVVEEKIPGSCDTTESSNWSPPKKRKRQAESAGGNPICTVKIRLLKPFVLKTDCIQQPDDANEDEEDNSDADDDYEGDDNRDDGEDAMWSEGHHQGKKKKKTCHFNGHLYRRIGECHHKYLHG
ncbi:uncharacterized protein LOC110055696 [Orbicella faveolata]|uniref:uncharacterized protein LOC110055696 n=1 Tax=Orbicella faveolata TaxID=48498 RepID=UPI0009E266BC|nr:uncharacterized protein LOC110055696 [Orbicella faveolata]